MLVYVADEGRSGKGNGLSMRYISIKGTLTHAAAGQVAACIATTTKPPLGRCLGHSKNDQIQQALELMHVYMLTADQTTLGLHIT